MDIKNLTPEQIKILANEQRKKYMREYRAKPENRQKQKEYTANYWTRKALAELELQGEG